LEILKDKVVLVTGSSRGIGAEIARLFAREGAKVALNSREAGALSSVQAEIEAAGGKAMQAAGDVTKFDEIEAMRRKIEETFGPVEILVANAGANLVMPGPLEGISEEGWRNTVDANLTAAFLTVKSFIPGMKERKAGNIITISSAAGRKMDGRLPIPYSAAKAGIQVLTQVLAAQVGPFGIRANCIAPETILTERNRQRIPEETKHTMAEAHPIRRLGTPEDVARAALFLASDAAGWITGVVLDVAGGSVLA
jgi:3-oxoacyl-[acyl-carrier protein] reductase